ncbi:signal transduction protein [Haemophilus influenzae]|uniref:Signal transduction protein n=1 Tax=Haemophilus influenzae TaxID=727 RepID=A0A2X1RUX6_HAEIF|nr:signal transduction protein [Haemophilus influenzae]
MQVNEKLRSNGFIYGGSVLGVGLLFGLLIPYVLPKTSPS